MAALKYWFKARGKHKIGWVPSTWEGWTVLGVYFVAVIYAYLQINAPTISEKLYIFFPTFLILTLLLTVVTYLMGEPTTWHKESTKVPEEEKVV